MFLPSKVPANELTSRSCFRRYSLGLTMTPGPGLTILSRIGFLMATWPWEPLTRIRPASAAIENRDATRPPFGENSLFLPTPDQLWDPCKLLTKEERTLSQAPVCQQRPEVRLKEGWPTQGPLTPKDARTVDRQAIRRALEEHGYLLYSRRRLP